nr:EOG090X0BWU [Eurycercus lamellatus]
MDNMESILDELNGREVDYERQRTTEIPKMLEEYICHLAKTGETLFPWPKIRGLIRHKLETVVASFRESCPTDNIPPCPNVEPFHFETMRDKILEQFDSFNCAPFTIQRLCELLCTPRKHYKRTDKFMRGIEKNLLVVSTVDPEQSSRKRSESVSSSQTLMNGVVELNAGSNRAAALPLSTFGNKSDQRPASAASDVASVSDADSGISDTEDEEKPAIEKKQLDSVVSEDANEEVKKTPSPVPPVELQPNLADEAETEIDALTLPMSTIVASDESLPLSESIVPVTEEEENPAPVEAHAEAPAEAPSETLVLEEETKIVTDATESGIKSEEVEEVKPIVEEERIVDSIAVAEEEGTTAPIASMEAAVISEKKRPLERVEGDEEDTELSPDAKQPRFFSPDKIVENPIPEEGAAQSEEESVSQPLEDRTAETEANVETADLVEPVTLETDSQ